MMDSVSSIPMTSSPMLLADYPKSNWKLATESKPTCECGSVGFERIPNLGPCRVMAWRCIGCGKETINLPPKPHST